MKTATKSNIYRVRSRNKAYRKKFPNKEVMDAYEEERMSRSLSGLERKNWEYFSP